MNDTSTSVHLANEMDVQKWLENTADRAGPVEADHLVPPDFIQPQLHAAGHQGRTYRHKKTRAISDSSIIELRPSHHNRAKGQEALRGPDSDPIRGADNSADSSYRSQSERSRSSALEEVPTKTYQRRARHKTKPDRYDHKSKKRKSGEDKKDHRKSKPKRRKSHRRDDGGRTSGLVQSFQLKNGTKNNRLTLKPQAAAGMFSHGRASAQIPGRETGLPDLVFNEMRFLQRPKEHQDETNRVEQSNSKKNRSQQHDEEISAYFAAPKTAPSIETGPINVKRRKTTGDETSGDKRLRHVNHHVKAHSVDEQPSNRSASLPLRKVSKADESYYTWSESLPRHSEPAFLSQAPGPSPIRLEAPTRSRQKAQFTVDNEINVVRTNKNAEISTGRRNPDKWRQSHKNGQPVPVKVYGLPSDPPELETRMERSIGQSASQSLPKRSSSAFDEAQLLRNDYHTSDILNLHSVAQWQEGEGRVSSPEKENRDPEVTYTSTPSSKLLQNALDAVMRAQESETQNVPHGHHAPEDFVNIANFELSRMLDAHRRSGHHLSHQRTNSDAQHTLEAKSTSQDHAFGPDQLPRRELRRGIAVRDAVPSQIPLWRDDLYDTSIQHDDGMYHQEQIIEDIENQYYGQPDKVYQTGPGSGFDETILEHEHTPTYDVNPLEITEHVPRGASVGHEFESDGARGETGLQAEHELAGFWRPHRLY